MWTCTKCGERMEEQSDSCRKCATPRGGGKPDPASPEDKAPKRRLAYRVFRGTWATWDQLFRQAARFANEVGPERLVSISHSEDEHDGVVAVWYWTSDDDAQEV